MKLSAKSVLLIDGISVDVEDPSAVQINFLGFVPSGKGLNKGEDRGFMISRYVLLQRFSRDGRGLEYYIAARYGNREIGRITILYAP